MPQRLMAERMLVSVQTLQRLGELVAPDTDRAGISEALARLPKTTHAVSSDDVDF